MYCDDEAHDLTDPLILKHELGLVHIDHLRRQDSTLDALADLLVDMGAERGNVGEPWIRFHDSD